MTAIRTPAAAPRKHVASRGHSRPAAVRGLPHGRGRQVQRAQDGCAQPGAHALARLKKSAATRILQLLAIRNAAAAACLHQGAGQRCHGHDAARKRSRAIDAMPWPARVELE